MKIKQEKSGLLIEKDLLQIFKKEIMASGIDGKSGINIRFKDPKYSSESGGYHPVEVAISDGGEILYITDFAYVGTAPFVELAKELDFDFGYEVFQQFGVDYALKDASEIFTLWQRNFICYYKMGVYTVYLENLI